MGTRSWLISWVGSADHESAEGKRGEDLGPVASALNAHVPFDKVILLTNYGLARSEAYCDWLKRKTGHAADLHPVKLSSPIDYAEIYTKVSKLMKQLGLPKSGVRLTFHLSPGTPAMAAIWIILAKTRFPARLIQTSREKGLEPVDFVFDLASEFLPEFLQRSSDRIRRLSTQPIRTPPEFARIVYRSQVMQEQVSLAQKIAAYDVPVLILGETGTGKELFAEAIHAASNRKDKPFVAINCGAIPTESVNSELFGHKKGAYTGAATDRKGHFREAEGGTLFLDEVGDLPLDAQVRLLRALQQQEITPLGESKAVKVNVRVVAATHRDLASDVAEGRFREDLFHRLAVGILRLPALRERGGDLDILLDHLIEALNADDAEKPEAQRKELSSEAKKLLLEYDWPGNVRELYHTLLRAAIWSSGAAIEKNDVARSLLAIRPRSSPLLDRPLGDGFDLQALLDDVARAYMKRALEQSGHKKTLAAELLGFPSYQTFTNRAGKLGVVIGDDN